MHDIHFTRASFSSIRTLYGATLSTLRASITAPADARQPHYIPPARANLIGRLRIACSGNAARRQRACTRLNQFAPTEQEHAAAPLHQQAQQIALQKLFRAAQGASRTTTQQMLGRLSDQALHTLWQHLDTAAPASGKLSLLELSACHTIAERQQSDPQSALAQQWHDKAQQRLTAHTRAQMEEEQQRSARAEKLYDMPVFTPMTQPAAPQEKAASMWDIVKWAWGVQLPQ